MMGSVDLRRFLFIFVILSPMLSVFGQISQEYASGLVVGPNKATCVIVFSPSNLIQKDFVVYAAFIQEKQFEQGFRLVAIGVNDTGDVCSELATLFRHTTFINDRHLSLSGLFQANSCCGAIYIYDQNGELKFKSRSLVSKEDLRTLVEKYLFGRIIYQVVTRAPEFFIGDPRSLRALDLVTGVEADIISTDNEYFLITFFLDICANCLSGRRLSTLNDIQKNAATRPNSALRIVCLFPSYYQMRDIADRGFFFKELNPGNYPYELIPIDDRYYLPKGEFGGFPVTYLVDNKGTILRHFYSDADEDDIRKTTQELIK
jgi:hypothetical protein